ncbi:hypothetical protein [Pseudomonas fluorescens]|uniref:hypothetical protein n=1 Tax=Pseudomonas fluorescens TaxID=294 RepID=UPI00123FFE20|nr:hypothetical protein [Pseudomonas fluorescens]
MKALKIAASEATRDCFSTAREVVPLEQTDFTDVAVAVLSVDDLAAGALGACMENIRSARTTNEDFIGWREVDTAQHCDTRQGPRCSAGEGYCGMGKHTHEQ